MLEHDEYERIKNILTKSGSGRSYDDILILKSYLLSLDFLRNLCSNMSPKQTEDLCRNMIIESHDYGSYVFKQGDPGENFYIVLSGTCDIISTNKVDLAHGESEIRERVIFSCTEGTHFGERALEYNEPRGASILCTSFLEVISISKAAYVEILRLNDTFDPTGLKKGSKPHIVKILSKARSKRTPLEIETCATFFERKIPFFQNFNFEQLCELARVAECICVYGKQILFKQDQLGTAFYVSLTGKVSVWIEEHYKDKDQITNTDSSTKSSIKRDITDGLGKCVTILPEGTHFGERALENDDSKRMASVVTDEDLTELIIISKVDYHNLISVMLSAENMNKVAVLRKTDIFSDFDVLHLNIMAKFMEQKIFKIDEVLFTAGTKAVEMVICSCGECRVEINIEQMPYKSKKEKKHKCSLGRLGPNSVLGYYITQCGAPYVDVYHTETVIANSLLHTYTIGKNDFYQNFPARTRDIIVNRIKDIQRPILPYLWDNYPKQVGTEDWKRSQAWNNFRHDILNSSRKQNILENMKDMEKVKIAPNSGNIFGHTTLTNTITDTDTKTWTTISASKDVNISSFGLEKPKVSSFHFPEPSFGKHKFIESALSRVDIRKSANFSKTHTSNTITESAPDSPISKTTTFEELPFSLIHIHRESIKYEASSVGFRRSLKVHMRVCGTVNTCSEAKDAASRLMRNAYLTLYQGDITRESEVELLWKEFSGFDSMPLHETDHFLIYCRNAPLEFSSLSPSEDLLHHNYPAYCKNKSQRYGCLSFRSISSTNSFNPNSSISDDFDTIKDPYTIKNTFPLFLLELSALEEVISTTTTELECRNYAVRILEKRAELANYDTSSSFMQDDFRTITANQKYSRESRDGERAALRGNSLATDSTKFANTITPNTNLNRRTCVVPMFDWFTVDDRTLSTFDINRLLADESMSKEIIKGVNENMKDKKFDERQNKNESLSKSLREYGLVSETFTAKSFALGSKLEEEKSQILAPSFSLRALDMEVANLSRKYNSSKKGGASRAGVSSAVPDSRSHTASSSRPVTNDSNNTARTSTKNVTEEEIYDPVKKLEKVKSLIDIRERVLKLNNDLCETELGIKKKKNQNNSRKKRGTGDDSDSDEEGGRGGAGTNTIKLTNNKNHSGMGLLNRRIEIFDALSSLPIQSNSASALNPKKNIRLLATSKSMPSLPNNKSNNNSNINSNSHKSNSYNNNDNNNKYDSDNNNNDSIITNQSMKVDKKSLSMKLDVLESILNRSKYNTSL